MFTSIWEMKKTISERQYSVCYSKLVRKTPPRKDNYNRMRSTCVAKVHNPFFPLYFLGLSNFQFFHVFWPLEPEFVKTFSFCSSCILHIFMWHLATAVKLYAIKIQWLLYLCNCRKITGVKLKGWTEKERPTL